MNRILCALAILSSLCLFSCKKNASVASVKRQELFSLKYGSFEDQLNMAGGLNATGAVNTAIAMRDGFFYVSNGESQKILELNSYGDLLTLYHNPETNPTPLFDNSDSRQSPSSKNVSTRKTVDYPFNAPSLLALDSSKYIYVAETLPKERQESGDNKILLQVVLRFNSSSFVDYIGQQGVGGTPFPFIRNIYVTQDDCLVVVCVVNEGFEVFRYNPQGFPLSDTLIKYSDAPEYGETKMGVTKYAEIENVIPDPASDRLFVKADYYETSIDVSSKVQNGISDPVSVVFPYDLKKGTFGTGIEIPPYEETISDGFSKQVYKLPYDMIGATKNGWLFFTIALESGCMVQMLNLESGRVVRRQLNFDAASVVYSSYSLSDTGIVSALLAERDKAKVVWWRTDTLVDQ
ncbi:MAG: hypothetical protein IK094_10065 [Treponema sp.]|nr:hypothetical protein [Treponema sp.]